MAITQQKPPYSTYAALVGVFGLGMSGLAGVASLRGRRPEQLRPLDFAILSAATFRAARMVSHDEVLSFLREPFVQGVAHEGSEKPVEDGGTRQAIGELLTCSRCIGMWAAALCVEYRDVGYILPVILQFLLFGSPVLYSDSVAAKFGEWSFVFYLNPLAGLLGAWKWSVLSTPFPPVWAVIYGVVVSFGMLVLGTMVFRRMERTFSDVI